LCSVAAALAICLCVAAPCVLAAGGEWPTYHGGFDLAGVAAGAVPTNPAMRWRFKADGPVGATPAVGGGRAYFTSDSGRIYAVTLSGTQVWTRAMGDTNAAVTFPAPPLYVADTLVLGSSSGRLYALDPATGATRWEYELGAGILGTPNAAQVSNDWRVVVLSQPDGVLHCVSLASGHAVWKSEKTGRCDGSPAVGGGRIVYGNCNADLYAFSVEDGGRQAQIPLGSDCQVAGGVAVLGDRAFSGSRCGRVFCADLDNQRIVWSNAVASGELFGTPAVSADAVVVGAGDGNVLALARDTGELKWKHAAGGPVKSAVVAAEQVVVSAGGKLLLLSLAAGDELWSAAVSDSVTSPAVAAGLILVGGDDGTLTAFGAPR